MAPVLAGVAVAAYLSTQAFGGSPAADVKPAPHQTHAVVSHSAATHSAIAAAAAKATQSKPKARPAARAQHPQLERHVVSNGSWYTVSAGDTLSGIAGRFYGQPSAWPVIYYANRGKIADVNSISPGEVLRIPAKPAYIPAPPAVSQPAATAAPAVASSAQSSASTASSAAASSYSGGGYPGGSFGACVVQRESGGNSQVMNSSGHYGLYQFAYSTWVAYGGNPADFGHASVAEQNQVFANALARGGQSNWSPYDGC